MLGAKIGCRENKQRGRWQGHEREGRGGRGRVEGRGPEHLFTRHSFHKHGGVEREGGGGRQQVKTHSETVGRQEAGIQGEEEAPEGRAGGKGREGKGREGVVQAGTDGK